MLIDKNYVKILNLLDRYFWDRKTDETNFNYVGLIIDYHFNSSILSIDYIDINDYFEENGDFKIDDCVYLSEQYGNLSDKERLKILENILNILIKSTINKSENERMVNRITEVLKRDFVRIIKDNSNNIEVVQDDVVDSGSYCNIVRVCDGILRKELKDEYKNNIKIKKRIKYEFENMKKLEECPQILRVYDYDNVNDTYTMEQGEINLYSYLTSKKTITFEEKVKIIKDIIKGIVYAYEKSIIHRDLHLGNVLKIGGDFLICDFGLSKDLSLERSMKSSYTAKNNHIFVDPYAINDFNKLDHKSDIYSIGKIMDYIFTYKGDENNPFKVIIERCISRDRQIRYNLAKEVLNDIDMVLQNEGKKDEKENIIRDIKRGNYNIKVHEFILSKVNDGIIGKFIVKYNLSSFGVTILKFANIYQRKIIDAIRNEFEEATGYGGWNNYDIFADISYYLCENAADDNVKNISKDILSKCANIRFTAKSLLEELEY